MNLEEEVDDNLANKLRVVAQAWSSGDALLAYERLSAAAPECDWLAEVVGSLCEYRVYPPDPAAEASAIRRKLDEIAESLQIPKDEIGISRLIKSLIAATQGDVRYSWLTDGHVADLLEPDLNGPMTLAVLGEFSSGKSSLINSLLGEKVLSVGIVPVTASVTRLSYSETPFGIAQYKGGRTARFSLDELKKHIDERAQSVDNDDRPIEVQIGLPVEFLKGCEIIDTPGFNSGIVLHDQSASSIVFQADAVIWVFDATQTGKESEWRELQPIRRSTRCFAVLNKIDEIDADPLALDKVISDLKKHSNKLFESIVPVSAKRMARREEHSGRGHIDQLLHSVRESAREIKESSIKQRRAELARKELARRVLSAEEKQEMEEERYRNRKWIQSLAEDWSDVVRAAAMNGESFQIQPSTLDDLTDVYSHLFKFVDTDLSDQEAQAVLEVLCAAERHSLLEHCSLTTEWRLIRDAILLRFATKSTGDDTAFSLKALAFDFREYCRLADRFLIDKEEVNDLVDLAYLSTLPADIPQPPYAIVRNDGELQLKDVDPFVLTHFVMTKVFDVYQGEILSRADKAKEEDAIFKTLFDEGHEEAKERLLYIYHLLLNLGCRRFSEYLLAGKLDDVWEKFKSDWRWTSGTFSDFGREMMRLSENASIKELNFRVTKSVKTDIALGRLWDGLTWRHFPRSTACLNRVTERLLDYQQMLIAHLSMKEVAKTLPCPKLPCFPFVEQRCKLVNSDFQNLANEFQDLVEQVDQQRIQFTGQSRLLFIKTNIIGLLFVSGGGWFAAATTIGFLKWLGLWAWLSWSIGVFLALVCVLVLSGIILGIYETIKSVSVRKFRQSLVSTVARHSGKWFDKHTSILQQHGLEIDESLLSQCENASWTIESPGFHIFDHEKREIDSRAAEIEARINRICDYIRQA
jgi:ribosome biogenesis GTPase A